MAEPRSKEQRKLMRTALEFTNEMESALHDLDRLLIAAMATLTVDKERIAVELDVQKDALETLLEYARREVTDVQNGLAGLEHVTTEMLSSEQPESPTNAQENEEVKP